MIIGHQQHTGNGPRLRGNLQAGYRTETGSALGLALPPLVMPPLVSIVIPTYNRAPLLERALASALAQTWPEIEIIVVDDGSTDGTDRVVARYASRVQYVRQANLGCAAAKNTGLAVSSGSLITNLDDDDLFHPEKVARQVEVFECSPEVGFCATGTHFIDESDRILRTQVPPSYPREMRVLHLLRFCPFVQSSVMVRRECHDCLGPYTLTVAEDYDFWLRASLCYDFAVVEEPLTLHRRHGSQMTSPEHNKAHLAALRAILARFLSDLTPEQICPILPAADVYATVGAILVGRKLYGEAEPFLQRALPAPAAGFWLGMLVLRNGELERAGELLTSVAPEAPLAPIASKILSTLHRHAGATTEPSGLREEIRPLVAEALRIQLAPIER